MLYNYYAYYVVYVLNTTLDLE